MSARRVVLIAAVTVSAGCVPTPPAPEEHAAQPAEFPAAYYRQAEAAGRSILLVDPVRSLVTIEVHRAGSLARLGHDHVAASHDVHGYVAPGEGRADLYVPLVRLSVDEPELRAEARFDTQPTEAAIEGTRRNMLDKVLEARRFPFALIHVVRMGATLKLDIALHGVTRTLEIPARIDESPDGMTASGSLSLLQSDFGIVPMSVLAGALQVVDRVDLRFRIVATRSSGSRRGA